MQKFLKYLFLLFFLRIAARDGNLVIIVDNLRQETVKTKEINMTHQLVTALQQKTSAILVSTTLWKNILDRKKKFAKQLEDVKSVASDFFSMYQTTNKTLEDLDYNLSLINNKLSHVWFCKQYSKLAALSAEDLNQIRFDFLCYTFKFNFEEWHVYNPHTGMLLFTPQAYRYDFDNQYKVLYEDECCKYFDKKSDVIESLQKLLLKSQDRWVIYLTGHGHPKSLKQDANIAGLKVADFKDLLYYFNQNMHLKLLVYASCYGGGVHSIEPYANQIFHYPIIVTALTDAPIFGFGLFEGIKLPPYDEQFKLQPEDVVQGKGLLPCALQDYRTFFKRAWKGYFDLHLVQLISRFFACDLLQCHVQKIENFPLIRKAGNPFFTPVKDGLFAKMVQQVSFCNSVVTATKPILLYAKKVKKIKMDQAVPIISMVPGMASHEIQQFYAPQISFSSVVSRVFLSLEDMQLYKNFFIRKLICLDDRSEKQTPEIFSDVFILAQKNLMPKFIHKQADALIYYQFADNHYLSIYNDQKIAESMILDDEQIAIMYEITKFVMQAIDFKFQNFMMDFITFNDYIENKNYQQELVGDCIKAKVCKKV